jgi:hypothetical protein
LSHRAALRAGRGIDVREAIDRPGMAIRFR